MTLSSNNAVNDKNRKVIVIKDAVYSTLLHKMRGLLFCSLVSFFLLSGVIMETPVEANDMEVYVDVAGLAQFGPFIGFGYDITPRNQIGAHVRLSDLGYMNTSGEGWGFYDDDEEVESGSYGIGASYKHFFRSDPEASSPYIGAILHYYDEDYKGDDGWTWEGSTSGIAVALNAGYRWRFSSGFFLNLGGYVGAAFDFEDEWHYTGGVGAPLGVTFEEDDTEPFLMIELSLGFEF